MIKVLITDDNIKRTKLITEAVANSENSHLVDITTCSSADAARIELLNSFDILILDVLLPKKDNSTPQASHSIKLLQDVCESRGRYIRPKIIIGLTADISSIGKYQEEFVQYATTVLSGISTSIAWLTTLLRTIDNYVEGERKILSSQKDTAIITIHGIRTYGHWQQGLNKGISAYSRSIECIEMKYGFFDLVSFTIPYLRDRKAKKIASRLLKILENIQDKDIHLIAHSFGSYITSEAMRDYKAKKLNTVILCGSPLRHDDDIDHIVNNSELTINECGTKDLILILARTTLLGLGDAGRVGFTREQTGSFLNRYFSGGHSLYFKENNPQFWKQYWLPSISTKSAPEKIDERTNYPGEDLIDISIKLLTIAKPLIYISLAALTLKTIIQLLDLIPPI